LRWVDLNPSKRSRQYEDNGLSRFSGSEIAKGYNGVCFAPNLKIPTIMEMGLFSGSMKGGLEPKL
jgi:hypothetical protein